jgi:hypothetical protein
MVKAASNIVIVTAALCCNLAFGEDDGKATIRIRPIQILSRAPVPKDIPVEMRPSGLSPAHLDDKEPITRNLLDDFLYPTAFEIWYLIEGRNIVSFDSMTIDSISTPEGHDISHFPEGKPSYTVGLPPKTTPDGKYCLCSLFVKQNQFGKVEQLSIKGHVTALVATEPEEKATEFGMATTKPERIGPFTVEVKPGQIPYIDHPASDLLNVVILGPTRQLLGVKATEGDKDIGQLSTWSDKARDIMVLKPKSGKFTLKLRFIGKLNPVKVDLGKYGQGAEWVWVREIQWMSSIRNFNKEGLPTALVPCFLC